MPYHLIRNVDFDAKRAAIANIKPADNDKLQLEFVSRYYDVSRIVSGQLVHLSAVSYSDTGTGKAPPYSRGAFISPDIGAIRSGKRVAREIAQG